MLRVAILGGSGYAGSELLRILHGHPFVKITAVTSERSAGRSVLDVLPHLTAFSHLTYEALNLKTIFKKADIFFLALPHKTAQDVVAELYSNDKLIIDLSADYRLKDPDVYEQWYKTPHRQRALLKKAVYGLPEIYGEKISRTRLVANPGCYPTGAILGLAPAVYNGLIDTGSITIDSKSGVSGAGRSQELAYMFSEVNDGLKAYAIGTHRHTPEIEQEISHLAKKEIKVNFTPHLIPMDRGILTTIYAKLKGNISASRIDQLYKDFYKRKSFVRILDEGRFPTTKQVRGTNYCEIALAVVQRTRTLIIVSVIDNLIKGASGQAIQNMNIMLGLKEDTALTSLALFP